MNIEREHGEQGTMLEAVDALKEQMLVEALKQTTSLSEAARRLGVNPRLVRYLSAERIRPQRWRAAS